MAQDVALCNTCQDNALCPIAAQSERDAVVQQGQELPAPMVDPWSQLAAMGMRRPLLSDQHAAMPREYPQRAFPVFGLG